MTQEEFTNLVATAAAGLAPIMLAHGPVSPERLRELAETAANLALQVSKEARTRYQAASGLSDRDQPRQR
jgi:hypothetical protein